MNEQALKDRLKAIARKKNTSFNDVWKQLVLERFLFRVSQSPHTDKFIFKGGYLLSYLIKIGRETIDLDFLLTRIKAEVPQITNAVKNIASINCHDGFLFSFEKVTSLNQPHMSYPGYRISLNTTFGNMKDTIHIDIGIGDVVLPETRAFSLFQYKGSPFFEGEMSLQVYPIEAIFAEKLETVISKGTANSRMKDFHDLFLLLDKSLLDKKKLRETIYTTFTNRNTTLGVIEFDSKGLSAMQNLWLAHYQQLGNIAKELNLPKKIEEVISKINLFLTDL